ncbi:unnamed protein product, partial [Dibothriocephalus latus]
MLLDPNVLMSERHRYWIDFMDAGMDGGKKHLKSAMNSKSVEFAAWKTSPVEVQNFIMQRTEPFFALIVNLFGEYFVPCYLF